MKIYPLKAAHGDALIVETECEGKTYRIVVDGGPEETAEFISDVFLKLEHIDLLVLTHYDEDHISGLLKYFERINGEKCIIDMVWANCASIVSYDDEENVSAYEDAYVLSKRLQKLQKSGIIGGWRDDVTMGMDSFFVGPFKIDVLSPTEGIHNELLRRYKDYIEREGLQDDPDTDEDVSFSRVQKDAKKQLSSLVSESHSANTTFMNKTSIALRIQAEEKTILLLGDSDAKGIIDSFESLGATKENPMKADLIKMPHHGSQANINAEWFQLIDCTRFLFTTNGGNGGAYHPDRKTIAYIDAWARRNEIPITLYFNYPLSVIMDRNVGLINNDERKRFILVDVKNSITI